MYTDHHTPHSLSFGYLFTILHDVQGDNELDCIQGIKVDKPSVS